MNQLIFSAGLPDPKTVSGEPVAEAMSSEGSKGYRQESKNSPDLKDRLTRMSLSFGAIV
jgi:hypothetical protein